jgi:Ca2+-binding RTX toxin-like protein
MTRISITSSTALEGSTVPTLLTFTLALEEPLTAPQTLRLGTIGNSAEATKDFTPLSTTSTVVFLPGETVKEVTVTILDDLLNEADESFFLNVTIPKLTPLNIGPTDIVVTNIGKITDTLNAGVTTTLAGTIENLFLTNNANVNGTGNNSNNILKGNSGINTLSGLIGDDTLDGGAGVDILIGGTGNDFYILEVNETITEVINQGIDTVQSSSNITLQSNLENLVLTGLATVGTGNAENNRLEGNNLANNLTGSNGNDTLIGAGGADTLVGDLNDDVYIIDNLDTVIEAINSGEDTIESQFNIDLSSPNFVNVENATIISTGNGNGNGSPGPNKLTGNTNANELIGGQGNDVLNGKEGPDTLKGDAGDDLYIVDIPFDVIVELPEEGIDVVETPFSYILGDNIERLILTGLENLEGIGNSLPNTINGNSGNNFLDGGQGIDVMAGGIGNDTYVVDAPGDTVSENLSSGLIDTVLSSINYILPSNVENLNLSNGTAISGTGNNLSNLIIGNDQNNNLQGQVGGNDTLDGGLGIDDLDGNNGSDLYFVDNSGDRVIETIVSTSTAEKDTVKASVTYTLSPNVEDLELTGTANLDGTGNISANKITGNVGNNILNGNEGNDTLDGGLRGQDSLSGGAGNDTLIGGSDRDSLTGDAGNDSLDGGLDRDTLIGGLGDDQFTVDNFQDVVTEELNQGTDLVSSSVTYVLSSNIENLTLTGAGNISGAGNNLANIIRGNNGINTIDGQDGNDSIFGGSGDDSLLGRVGNDSLDGSLGNDFLVGNSGNDIYFVDVPTDVIREEENEGTETVFSTAISYTLGANLENLTLVSSAKNGIGNDLNNTITASTSFVANLLNGGAGNDTLIGLGGADTYVVDAPGDVINESVTTLTEIDTVISSVSYALGNNLEVLQLVGADPITGIGNALSNLLIGNNGNNTLTDDIGNDSLDGGQGVDTMAAGMGNDTYVISDIGDLITEIANSGRDSVFSNITYTLADNLENLTLTNLNNINGTGNTLNNVINGNQADNILTGNAGDDIIIGRDGNDVLIGQQNNDTLTGGNGNDMFNYNTGVAFSGSDIGSDRIIDFAKISGNSDKIVLGKNTFALASNLGTGFSVASEFAIVATDEAAKASSAQIVYTTVSGNIFYNPNGVVVGGESIVTTLSNIPILSATDFMIEA